MDRDKIFELFIDCVKTALITGQGHLVNVRKFDETLNPLVSEDELLVKISCQTCRKNKSGLDVLTARTIISCKHGNRPCREWLPSKRDIDVWIARQGR